MSIVVFLVWEPIFSDIVTCIAVDGQAPSRHDEENKLEFRMDLRNLQSARVQPFAGCELPLQAKPSGQPIPAEDSRRQLLRVV